MNAAIEIFVAGKTRSSDFDSQLALGVRILEAACRNKGVIALGVTMGTFGTHNILPGVMTVVERQLALLKFGYRRAVQRGDMIQRISRLDNIGARPAKRRAA